jgi:hypothetical protein
MAGFVLADYPGWTISQPTARQAAMEPRLFSTRVNPFRRSMDAAMMAR